MAFRVEIEPEALEDLDSIADYIKARSSFATAEKWFNGMMNDIASLKEMPARCPLAPEAKELGAEIRLLLHGKKNRGYKIYFTIHQKTESSGSVQVLHVRHWARKPLGNQELDERIEDEQDGCIKE